MRKTILRVALCAMFFALCSFAEAQQPGRIPRIGFLPSSGDTNNPGIEVRAFQQRLRDLGYIEGKNILIDYRYAEGKADRIQSLVAELVRLKVDVPSLDLRVRFRKLSRQPKRSLLSW